MQATHEYHKLLERILNEGTHKKDRTGTGTTSIFSHQYKVDMKHGFPLITTKRLHTKSIIHELLWFLSGDTNIKYLNDNGVTIWDKWADKDGNLGPVYGKQWVNWGVGALEDKYLDNINQIQNSINLLKTNPDSRRNIISAWNVGELDQMALPPCHLAFQLYTEELTLDEREKLCSKLGATWNLPFTKQVAERWKVPSRKLSLKWHQRSVDSFLGLPFNIASYAFLLHMFAQQTNMVPGILIGDLTNVHIYDNHIEYVKKQLKRPYHKYHAPTLKLTNYIEIDAGDNGERIYNNDITKYSLNDFTIENYESYPNWKDVPIAV